MTYRVSTRQITETVAPVVEPITLAEAKHHLRVDFDDDDTLITAQIKAARQWVENHLQRSLVQRTYRADIGYFAGMIELPMMPLLSLTEINYYTNESPQALTTLDSGVYGVNTGYNHLYLADGQSLPSTAFRHDAVQITYVAGYPAYGSPEEFTINIPEAIKSALKLMVGDLYELREVKVIGTIQSESPTMKYLLAAFRNL